MEKEKGIARCIWCHELDYLVDGHCEECRDKIEDIKKKENLTRRRKMATKKTKVEVVKPLSVVTVIEIPKWRYLLIDLLCRALRLDGDTFVIRVKETGFTMDNTDYTHVSTGIKIKRDIVEGKSGKKTQPDK